MPGSVAQYFAAVDPVINRSFYGLEDPKTPRQFDKIFDVASDDEPQRSFVEYAGAASLTAKTENAPVAMKQVVQGPIKTHYTTTYAGALTFSYEAVTDVKNRYAKIVQPSGGLGRATRVTPELLTALYLDRAFNSSFPATADGIELCGVHILPDGVTTFQNELATPAALDEAALEDVRVALRGTLSAEGNLMPLKIRQMVVPSAYEPIAMKLKTSDKTLGSANNDPSVVQGTGVQVFDYLGSSTRWLVQTDGTDKTNPGLFWDWIEKPQFITDQVVLMLQKVYVAFFRARFGCGDWRDVYGSAAT
jgi:hypothetical protein